MKRLSPVEQPSYGLLAKLVKFSVVGLSGVGVNSGMLYILYELIRLPLLAASAMAIEASVTTNFLLNAVWTFDDPEPSLSRFARFNLVSLGGMLIAITTLQALVAYLGLHYMVANLVGIGLGTVWNFSLNLFWTWGLDH